MPRHKVTVIGAGNVGATTAQRIAEAGLADVVLVDIVEGLPQGKALDLRRPRRSSATTPRSSARTTTPTTAGSDVIVVTVGLAAQAGHEPRRPAAEERGDRRRRSSGAGRAALAGRDPDRRHQPARRDVPRGAEGLRLPARARHRHGRRARLGALPHVHRQGAGRLASRMSHAFVLGGHGDTMVPLPRYSTVAGVPITELLPTERIDGARAIAPRNGGAEIVAAPQDRLGVLRAGGGDLRDGRRDPAATASGSCRAPRYLQGEYGVNDLFVGVPVMLGRGGLEQRRRDRADRRTSRRRSARRADAVQELVDKLP